jgi:hypothetical protein
MSKFPGRPSPEEHINTLVAIMIERHGHKAEQFARQRVRRCALALEPEWAERWGAVADNIARQTEGCDD